MLFNSYGYALFLPVVFAVYWLLNRSRLGYQNLFLLLASYFFYACWDWRFLLLLTSSTVLDYGTGLKIDAAATQRAKKTWLLLSLIVNIGLLGFFKYYNFFAANAAAVTGLPHDHWALRIVLPVGISFYTFHGVSYLVDIYRGRIRAEKNYIAYALFVSFFPLLIAGPIERATHLLPQLRVRRSFHYQQAADGLRQILWGLFVKIVVADSCAKWADAIFDHYTTCSGSTLVVGAVLFAFQIYGDFSAYSDMAIGTGHLLGIDLMRNFAYPYFSRDVAEFWRRWHISLTSWFRDYVYIPLGGNRAGWLLTLRNVLFLFLISGLWHGANWTFLAWGLINALYFLPLILSGRHRHPVQPAASLRRKELGGMLGTFALITFSWIFFRSASVADALLYIRGICSPTLLTRPRILPYEALAFCLLLLLADWQGRRERYAIAQAFTGWPRPLRWLAYCGMGLLICYYSGIVHPFIYFQF